MTIKPLSFLSFCYFFVFSIVVHSQNIQVTQENSYSLFVETLNNSKDLRFQEILKKYDDYLLTNPNDVKVKVYRCRFIGSSYYDEYEDYDLNYEETEACIEKLYAEHPDIPEVILYKLERLYGEERRSFLEASLEKYEENKSDWNYNNISKLFKHAAQWYDEENDRLALSYAKKAERYSDSLDLSILISKIHLRLGNKEKAIETIESQLYLDSEAWILNQKGSILLDLGKYEEALNIFDRVKEKDSTIVNNTELYKIFVKAENYDIARNYLVKDTLYEWNKLSALQKLAKHDIEFSSADVALSSYRRLQKESYFDDLLSVKRLKIFLKSPFKGWNLTELSHLLMLILVIAIIFLIPYLWILPVYSVGKLFSKRIKINESLFNNGWNLKHFWKISFVYLLVQFLLILVLYYQDYMNYLFDIGNYYYDELEIESEQSIANSFLLFSITLFAGTVLFLNKERLRFVLKSNLSIVKMILFGVLFVIANSILLKFFGSFVDLQGSVNSFEEYNINGDVLALVRTHGFMVTAFFVAILAPFYEEIIFRGIILSSCQKHIGFAGANVVQATLFATIHFNLKLFIFYLIFGLITGLAVKKTKGLLTGMIFHAINNSFVLLIVYLTTRFLSGLY